MSLRSLPNKHPWWIKVFFSLNTSGLETHGCKGIHLLLTDVAKKTNFAHIAY